MSFRSSLLATLALTALGVPSLAFQGPGRAPTDHPNLRAALHELREARQELAEARETWPAGHKERAMAALGDGLDSIRSILQVKDVDSFHGVDRNPDYYKKFSDHPRLRAALEDLRQGRDELRRATSDYAGLKERTLDDIDVAVGEIVFLMKPTNRPPRPR